MRKIFSKKSKKPEQPEDHLQRGSLGLLLEEDPEVASRSSLLQPTQETKKADKADKADKEKKAKNDKSSSKKETQPSAQEMSTPKVCPVTELMQNTSKLRTKKNEISETFEDKVKVIDFTNLNYAVDLEKCFNQLQELEDLRMQVASVHWNVKDDPGYSYALYEDTKNVFKEATKTVASLRFSMLQHINGHLITLAELFLKCVQEANNGLDLARNTSLCQLRDQIAVLEKNQKELVKNIKLVLDDMDAARSDWERAPEIRQYIQQEIEKADTLLIQSRKAFLDKQVAFSVKTPPTVPVSLREIKDTLPKNVHFRPVDTFPQLFDSVQQLELLNFDWALYPQNGHVQEEANEQYRKEAQKLCEAITQIHTELNPFLSDDDQLRVRAVLATKDLLERKHKILNLEKVAPEIKDTEVFKSVYLEIENMLSRIQVLDYTLYQQILEILKGAKALNDVVQKIVIPEHPPETLPPLQNEFEPSAPFLENEAAPGGWQEFKQAATVRPHTTARSHKLDPKALKDDAKLSTALRNLRRVESASDIALCDTVFAKAKAKDQAITKEKACAALLRVGIHVKVVKGSAQKHHCMPSKFPILRPDEIQSDEAAYKITRPLEEKFDHFMTIGGHRGLVAAVLANRQKGMSDLDICSLLFASEQKGKITLKDVARACYLTGMNQDTVFEAGDRFGRGFVEILEVYAKNMNEFNTIAQEKREDAIEEAGYLHAFSMSGT